MRILRAAAVGVAMLAVVIGIAAYVNRTSISNLLNFPEEISVRDRLVAQWQAMDLMDRAVVQHPSPEDWSGGAFIGTAALDAVFDTIEGSRLEYVPSDGHLADANLNLDKIDLHPEVGRLEADLTMSARKGIMILHLTVTALVSYQGTERVDDETVNALLRIDPLSVKPTVRFGVFDFQLRDFWVGLIPELATAFSGTSRFVVRIPLADTMRVSFKLDRRATEAIGDSAQITYVATLPESTIMRRVSYSAPVVLPSGLWVLGMLSASGQEVIEPSDPPTRDAVALRDIIGNLERRLSAKSSAYAEIPAGGVFIRINKEVFVALGNDIATLPDAKRRINVRSIQTEGRLAEKKWRDNLLGEGGAFAELSGNDALKGSIQFGKPSVTWSNDRLAFALPVTVTSESSLHVHVDPLIGGGMGTTVGIAGSGAVKITGTATPQLLSEGATRAALLRIELQCKTAEVVVASDGRVKVDFGWTKIPSIGAKLQVPVGGDNLPPTLLFDGRVQLIEIPVAELGSRGGDTLWRIVPAHPAIKVALVPSEARSDSQGFAFSADLAIAPLARDTSPKALAEARQAIADEASAYAARVAKAAAAVDPQEDCALEPSFAVLLGGIEFGSQNEIVKFARNAWSDITKGPGPNNELRKLVEGTGDAVDHATKEAVKSVDKLVTKPGQAIQDFGTQILRGFR